MAKRGQRYPYRVAYVWTSGIGGTDVASSLDEAESKAARIERYGLARDDADVAIEVIRVDGPGLRTIVSTRNTARSPADNADDVR